MDKDDPGGAKKNSRGGGQLSPCLPPTFRAYALSSTSLLVNELCGN